MTYQPDNLRVTSDDGTSSKTWLWDDQNYLSQTESGVLVFTNTPDYYGDLVSQNDGTDSNWYHFDARGDTRELTNASETKTDTRLYDAWGDVINSTGTTELPFQFVGRLGYLYDSAIELSYVRARWYESPTARWLSEDPIQYTVGMNLFNAFSNAPIMRVDPTGLFDLGEVGGGQPGVKGKTCLMIPATLTVKPEDYIRMITDARRYRNTVDKTAKAYTGVTGANIAGKIASGKCCKIIIFGHRGGWSKEGIDGIDEKPIFTKVSLQAIAAALRANKCRSCEINAFSCQLRGLQGAETGLPTFTIGGQLLRSEHVNWRIEWNRMRYYCSDKSEEWAIETVKEAETIERRFWHNVADSTLCTVKASVHLLRMGNQHTCVPTGFKGKYLYPYREIFKPFVKNTTVSTPTW